MSDALQLDHLDHVCQLLLHFGVVLGVALRDQPVQIQVEIAALLLDLVDRDAGPLRYLQISRIVFVLCR